MRRFSVFLVCGFLLVSGIGFSAEPTPLEKALQEFSQGISQTAYSMQERENSAERLMYERAVAKTERAEQTIRGIISKIDSPEQLEKAMESVGSFGKRDKLSKHASDAVQKMLQERAVFLQVSGLPVAAAKDEGDFRNIPPVTARAPGARPKDLLSSTQRRLIMISVPTAEAVVFLDDNKEERRVKALKDLLARHKCHVLSSAENKDGEVPRHNFYISGKKFVLEALTRHFKGTPVDGNLKAVLAVSAGGFWSGASTLEFTIKPTAQAAEKGNLSWYQAVLEKDPFKYLAENEYAKLSQLGKVEVLAGEKKLRVKNAKAALWVIAENGTKRDAIYTSTADFGDVYVNIP
jgi:hypothetical protein